MSRARNRPAGEIQVGERQQREHLCGVLVEAAIAHLAVAELALHDTEHMFDLRADFPEAAIAGTLVSRQPVSWFGLLLHRPTARLTLPLRASWHRWRSPYPHTPRCRRHGSNGPSPSRRARCRW